MNPLWILAAAIVIVPAIPIAAIGLHQAHHRRKERALGRRRKPKIQL